ncbi:hypothetical protein Gotur_016933 [Gossypium turneri]
MKRCISGQKVEVFFPHLVMASYKKVGMQQLHQCHHKG